jgi:hypothetical protein
METLIREDAPGAGILPTLYAEGGASRAIQAEVRRELPEVLVEKVSCDRI